MPTLTLAHPLSPSSVTRLGLPVGPTYGVGSSVTTDTGTALRLISAGVTTVNPADTALVTAVVYGTDPLPPTTPGVTPIGQWFVTPARVKVDLAGLRAANRVPATDIYRIVLNSTGAFVTFRWARAGQQVTDREMTEAESVASPDSVPDEPVTAAGGGAGTAAVASAVTAEVNARRETPSGLAGLDATGKLIESRLPDRLSAASLDTTHATSRNRANHTGTQGVGTISGLDAHIRAVVAAALTGNVAVAHDPTLGTITLTAAAGGGGTGATPYIDPTRAAVVVVSTGKNGIAAHPTDPNALLVTTGSGVTPHPTDPSAVLITLG